MYRLKSSTPASIFVDATTDAVHSFLSNAMNLTLVDTVVDPYDELIKLPHPTLRPSALFLEDENKGRRLYNLWVDGGAGLIAFTCH